jgi:hypothetical protein
VRYYRMPRNTGSQPNFLSALRRARGVFAVSLADDDGFDPDGLADAIDWMSANPTCVALYGPLDHYDAVTQTSSWLSYGVPGPMVFSPAQRCAAVRLVARHGIIPEMPIIRSSVLGNVLLPCKNLYYIFFQLLERLLAEGPVCFRGRPHYRILLRQWEGDDQRSTLSRHGDFQLWEGMYRGAYALYASALIADGATLSAEERRTLDRDVEAFANELRNSAIYTLSMAGRFSDAVELVKWLASCGALNREPGVLKRLMAESAAAALYAVIDIVDGIPELDRVVLYRLGQHAGALIRGFRNIRPTIEVRAVDDAADIGDAESALILTADDPTRDSLIAAGGLAGKIVCLPRLVENFNVRPWLDFAGAMPGT